MKPAEFRGYTKGKLESIEKTLGEIKELVKLQNGRIGTLEKYKARFFGWREAILAVVTVAVTALGFYIKFKR